jgi:hypothetical protein
MLHGTRQTTLAGVNDLVWWNASQLTRWLTHWLKRHAENHGVFVVRDASTVVTAAIGIYLAPTRHLDTIHVATSYAVNNLLLESTDVILLTSAEKMLIEAIAATNPVGLIASTTSELEGLDEGYLSTGGIPTRWFSDRIGSKTTTKTATKWNISGSITDAISIQAWTNHDNARIVDGTLASVSLSVATPQRSVSTFLLVNSPALKGGGLPPLPNVARVDGIQIQVLRRTDVLGVGAISTLRAALTKDAGTTWTGGTGIVGMPDVWADTTLTYHTFGGPTELWGATWTAAEINASGFGFGLQIEYTGTREALSEVDGVLLTVYYTTLTVAGTGQNAIGLYPVPTTTGATLEVIYHEFPCSETADITAPVVVGDYLELAVVAEAYSVESDGRMLETATSARQVMGLIDDVIESYYGGAQ